VPRCKEAEAEATANESALRAVSHAVRVAHGFCHVCSRAAPCVNKNEIRSQPAPWPWPRRSWGRDRYLRKRSLETASVGSSPCFMTSPIACRGRPPSRLPTLTVRSGPNRGCGLTIFCEFDRNGSNAQVKSREPNRGLVHFRGSLSHRALDGGTRARMRDRDARTATASRGGCVAACHHGAGGVCGASPGGLPGKRPS
jgi:hypothetical protein